MRLPLAGPRC